MSRPTHSRPQAPPDCMSQKEASSALGIGVSTLRDWLRAGQIEQVTISVTTSTGRWVHYRFPKRDAVSKLQGVPRPKKSPPGGKTPAKAAKPRLSDPDDAKALEARRELWSRNNRKFCY